jgi:O-antigen ligase
MPCVTLRQIVVLTTVIVALAVTGATGRVPRQLEELFRPMVQMARVRWEQAIDRYRGSGPFLGTGREEFLRLAKEKIRLNPITGDFGYPGAQGIYSHNTFYDALAQMGLIWGSILLFVAVMPVYIFVFNMKKICNNKILLFLFLTYFASMMRGFISNTLLGVPHFWYIVGGITSYYSIVPVARRKSCRSAD